MSVQRVIQLLRDERFDDLYGDLVKVDSMGPFHVLNYTSKCVYARKWDEVTRVCRGLVIDTRDWSVAALPFPKFFNLNEDEETMLERLPKAPFLVTEKMDGSLGILWRDEDGNFRISTRGNFTGEQAIWGTEFLQTLPNLKEIPQNYTLLFEIVYDDNKSVISYPFEGLVLLAVMDRWNLTELSFETVEELAGVLGVPTPKTYSFSTVTEARESAALLPYNEEGYVIRFENGFRVKVKGQEYLRVHRLYWSLSEKRIIAAITDGVYEELLQQLPEEFRGEAEGMANPIFVRADELREESLRFFRDAPKGSRKEFALWVQSDVRPELMGVLFSMMDEREIDWVQLAAKLA